MDYDLVVDLNSSSNDTWQLCHIQTGRPDITNMAIKVKAIQEHGDGSTQFQIEKAIIDVNNRYFEIHNITNATTDELKEINKKRVLEGFDPADSALKVYVNYKIAYSTPKVYSPPKPLIMNAKRIHKLDINMNTVNETGKEINAVNDIVGILVGPKICTFRVVW